MTRDEAVVSIMNRLGNRTDLQTSIETELLVVQQALLEGHEWLPWFLLTETATTITAIGEERVAVPTDFLQEDEEQALWRYAADDSDNPWKELVKDDLDVLRQKHPGTGTPLRYALRGSYFILKPTPDAQYTLKMSYYGRAQLMSTNIENAWLKHAPDLVISEGCYLMAKDYIKDMESANGFVADVKRAWNRLYRQHVARQEAGAPRMMGDD